MVLIVGWPQTVHVPPVLHAVASCAPAQLVYINCVSRMNACKQKNTITLPAVPIFWHYPGTIKGQWTLVLPIHFYYCTISGYSYIIILDTKSRHRYYCTRNSSDCLSHCYYFTDTKVCIT